MSDELPSSASEKSGHNEAAANASHNESKENPKKERKPRQPSRKWFGLTKSKWRELAGIFLLIPWVWNDLLDCHTFSKLCLLAASLAIAQGIICSFWGVNWKTLCVWLASFIPVAIVVGENSRPAPSAHFIVSLQTEDSLPVSLTNSCLFLGEMENTVTNANKTISFKMFSTGCIIIPVNPSKTNVVLNFKVENDSAVKVDSDDLAMIIGFPADWEIGVDSAKWKESREHFDLPNWRLEMTNVQYWAADVPYPLFPSDSISFSVTNFTVPLFTNAATKNGLLEFTVRSTGFEKMISANLIFFPESTNFFKPVVTSMIKDTNGVWHISLTSKEFEASQQ